jgi:hypothetical protein
MRRFLAAVLFLLTVFPAFNVGAGAQEFNHTITVYAVVPEQRVVYLDGSGNIIKVAGNTAKNVAPTVMDSSDKEVAMTPAVQEQYDDFLKLYDNHLQPSRIYEVNPVRVNNAANTQTIEIDNSNLSLGGLRID